MNPLESIQELREALHSAVIGQEKLINRLLTALLTNGSILIEGRSGLGKTRSLKVMSRHVNSVFCRLQCTPDLLVSDLTGSETYYAEGNQGTFKFHPGPLFGNFILIDEINRAPAKVQAALLQALDEHQITVAGKTYQLSDPLLVLATQNSVKQEGSRPLSEAQLDRFLLQIFIHSPRDEDEQKILQQVRSEEAAASVRNDLNLEKEEIFAARQEVSSITVADPMERYIVDLISATRNPGRYSEDLRKWIQTGISPRGTIALDKAARAQAWLQGRLQVLPEDVREVIHDCLRHRLILSSYAQTEGISASKVLDEITKLVSAP